MMIPTIRAQALLSDQDQRQIASWRTAYLRFLCDRSTIQGFEGGFHHQEEFCRNHYTAQLKEAQKAAVPQRRRCFETVNQNGDTTNVCSGGPEAARELSAHLLLSAEAGRQACAHIEEHGCPERTYLYPPVPM